MFYQMKQGHPVLKFAPPPVHVRGIIRAYYSLREVIVVRVNFYEDIAYFLRAIIVKSQSLIVYYLIRAQHVVIGIAHSHQ